jgi:hypothetical protein
MGFSREIIWQENSFGACHIGVNGRKAMEFERSLTIVPSISSCNLGIALAYLPWRGSLMNSDMNKL